MGYKRAPMSVALDRQTMSSDSRPSDFAKAIARELHDSGLSSRDVSYRMRVLIDKFRLVNVSHSASSISSWSRGETFPRRTVIRLLADALILDVPLDGETSQDRSRSVATLRAELEALWDKEDDRRRGA